MMGEKAGQISLKRNVKGIMNGNGAGNTNWVVKEDVNNDVSDSIFNGLISEDSMSSMCSPSSSKLAGGALFSSTSYLSISSSSTHSNNPLFDLSDLRDQLPLKRGLSMFYQGKAQSFSSLASVESIEDLPKKEKSYRKKMKSCDSHKISFTPKATISKKTSRGTFVSMENEGLVLFVSTEMRGKKSGEMGKTCTDHSSFIHGEMRRIEEKVTLATTEKRNCPSEKSPLHHVQDSLLHLHACRDSSRKRCRFTGHSNGSGG
ncbi:hypothetical protein Fmac_003864 [Flemingia macrophylla]|uniref:Uncharacterized protein n=1 Tax=Flemingia macrophylla TaxID=520843 RepID=A0ABD1N3D6_9FABA